MTTQIKLTDFQCHKDTALNLRGGFCCLLGPTNAGKSSIVRALRWLIYDSLHGKRFIRSGAKSTSVSLEFSDGKVERVKGENRNAYKVNDTTLESVGVGVPVEVRNATKIHSIPFDKDVEVEINVSSQLQSPFLLLEPDSYKAKALNALSGNHVFDVAIRETKRIAKDVEDKRSRASESIERYKKELERFEGLDEKERKLSVLEQKIDRHTQVSRLLETVVAAQRTLSSISATTSALRQRVKDGFQSLEPVVVAVKRVEEISSMLDAINSYRSASAVASAKTAELSSCDRELSTLKSEFLSLPETVCESCGQLVTKSVREAAVS